MGIIRTVFATEAATGFGILLLLVLPVTPALFLLPILGIALDGTSSVLYGTVAEEVAPERRSRVYGLFTPLASAREHWRLRPSKGNPLTLRSASLILACHVCLLAAPVGAYRVPVLDVQNHDN